MNNAIYLNYFEEARIDFFGQIIGKWDWKKHGIVLARNEVDYRAPIYMNNDVKITTSVEEIGQKSLTFSYRVFNGQKPEQIFAEGRSVIVCFDFDKQSTIDVPQAWRDKLS